MLGLRDVHRRFDAPEGPLHVLRGVDLDVAAGERVLLQGPSGAGKSTLLAIAGLIDGHHTGQVLIDGQAAPPGDRERAALRLRVLGHAFQDLHLVPGLTAVENVALPARAAGLSVAQARERAAGLLERAGLAGRARHRPEALSGGERRRVAVARALVNRPRLLLLDEPLANLDADARAGVLALLEATDAAMLIATHDALPADRVVRLQDGRAIADGGTS